MTKPTDRNLLGWIREHLDVDALLAAHPEVTRADLAAFWRRRGLGEAPTQRDLFDQAPPTPDPRPRGTSLALVARCDGAARGNPGPAAIGAVLSDAADGQAVLEISERIGRATNNVAEYAAVIRAVEQAVALRATEVSLLLDSQLLVNQLQGRYKVKAPHLRPLHRKALALLGQLARWQVRYVPREQNHAADRLANMALDGKRTP